MGARGKHYRFEPHPAAVISLSLFKIPLRKHLHNKDSKINAKPSSILKNKKEII